MSVDLNDRPEQYFQDYDSKLAIRQSVCQMSIVGPVVSYRYCSI